jgi:peptide/nickel transport system permease protein
MEWFVKRLGISVLLVWLVATIVFLAIYTLST